jgi:hypothetical protein
MNDRIVAMFTNATSVSIKRDERQIAQDLMVVSHFEFHFLDGETAPIEPLVISFVPQLLQR